MRHKFNDDCPLCKPVMLDAKTMKPLPMESPEMQAMYRVWHATTFEEREAFHKFTCLNSRADSVMGLVGPLMQRVEEEIKKSQPPQGTTEADNET